MKFIKQNRRNTGNQEFPYAITFENSTKELREFIEIRNWVWETFGPGIEYWVYENSSVRNTLKEFTAWGWINDLHPMRRTRILFKNEQDFVLATLKWKN